MKYKHIIFLISVVVAMKATATLHANSPVNFAGRVDATAMEQWVDSVMQKLTPDARLGQLIISIVQCQFLLTINLTAH